MLHFSFISHPISLFSLTQWLIVSFLLVSKAHCQDPIGIFVTDSLKPQPLLIELLQLDNLYDPNDSLQDIVDKTQKKWVAVRQGQNQRERTDLIDSPEQQRIREKVVAVAERMGLFSRKAPSMCHYTYGACLGSFLSGVRKRLMALIEAWEQGVTFDTLVFFSGERDLRKGVGEPDDFEALCDPQRSPLPFKANWKRPNLQDVCYETEYDMMRLVWEQVQLPEDMAASLVGRVIFVNALKSNGKRPSTADTYIAWLRDYQPLPGSLLAPSDPLLWCYQQLVGMRVLGQGFLVDTTNPGSMPQLMKTYQTSIVSLIFDTVAKCLYEINNMNVVCPVGLHLGNEKSQCGAY